MRFLLKIPPETVSSEHLQRAEKNKMTKLTIEIGLVDRLIFAQGIDILLQQFLTETIGILRLCLPQERSDIIIERPFSSALKVDKPRFTVFDHHIAALKIAVHKSSGRTAQQHITHLLKVVLQFIFLKFHAGSLKETIFEVIQIPKDRTLIELRLRIATGKVEAVGSGKLYGRKQTDRLTEQLFFLFGKYAGSTSFLDCMKQKGISQILLKIVTLIFGNDMNFGYRQAGLAEMGCHIKESIILLDRRATYADQGFRTCQPEVAAVGTGRW